jgi:hypothetical protein
MKFVVGFCFLGVSRNNKKRIAVIPLPPATPEIEKIARVLIEINSTNYGMHLFLHRKSALSACLSQSELFNEKYDWAVDYCCRPNIYPLQK